MFAKFASAEVLGFKSAPTQQRTASLSKFAEYNDYRTDDDYLYVRVRAISSRVNKNHDGWPADELQKSYRTFVGKPIFIDHHNSDPKKARGVVVDAALHIEEDRTSSLDPYYASAPENHKPPTWVELLLEVDAKTFPKLAKAVVGGDIDGVSMGCNVERSRCSVCSNWAKSPEEYCAHVRSKGAYFDHVAADGSKTSKRSYEDCYDIGFFELSFVFDPADETALVRDIKTAKVRDEVLAEAGEAHVGAWFANGGRCPHCGYVADPREMAGTSFCPNCGFGRGGPSQRDYLKQNQPDLLPQNQVRNSKTADRNPPPQVDMMKAPEDVDTLRQEQMCPICGSTMEDGVCEVCNYEEPPEGFDNPDLQKAQELDETQQNTDTDAQPQAAPQGGPPMPPTGGPPAAGTPPTQQMAASTTVKTDMSDWNVAIRSRTAADNRGGRINTQERPILPVARQNSDKPNKARVLKDSTRPVESKSRGDQMPNRKQADGASPLNEDVAADKRVNVTDVGGFDADVSADGTVEVDGVGGFLGNPESDTRHEDVDTAANITGTPTKTWSGQEGQTSPVTREKFKGVPQIASTEHDALLLTGDPLDGIKRVKVDAPIKEVTGPPTQTWKNDKGEADPVTDTPANATPDLGTPAADLPKPRKASDVRTHIIKSMKLAEAEAELGLIDPQQKYERAAELEEESADALDARLDTVAKVKTAGFARKQASRKTASRMPSLHAATSGIDPKAHEANVDEDSSIFM